MHGKPCLRALDADSLPGRNPVLSAISSVYFQDVCCGAGDGARLVVEHWHLLQNPDDGAIRSDEQHVERKARVVHPKGVNPLLLPGEKHTCFGTKVGAVHQATLLIRFRLRELDVNDGLRAAKELHTAMTKGDSHTGGWRAMLGRFSNGGRHVRQRHHASRGRLHNRCSALCGSLWARERFDGDAAVIAALTRCERQVTQGNRVNHSSHGPTGHTTKKLKCGRTVRFRSSQLAPSGLFFSAMRWPVSLLAFVLCPPLACGGPSAPLPKPKGRGGSPGIGGQVVTSTAGGATSRGGSIAQSGSSSGGTVSTYVDPGCPEVVTPEVYAECSVSDQSTCPSGTGCYPTIEYPSAPCQPETYNMLCLPAGTGEQWDDCESLLDCAPGFICVVTGIGTECQRACDPSAPTSTCPKGLFCESIDLQGIGSCY